MPRSRTGRSDRDRHERHPAMTSCSTVYVSACIDDAPSPTQILRQPAFGHEPPGPLAAPTMRARRPSRPDPSPLARYAVPVGATATTVESCSGCEHSSRASHAQADEPGALANLAARRRHLGVNGSAVRSVRRRRVHSMLRATGDPVAVVACCPVTERERHPRQNRSPIPPLARLEDLQTSSLQDFHGACPPSHRRSSSLLSRNVSMHCQNDS